MPIHAPTPPLAEGPARATTLPLTQTCLRGHAEDGEPPPEDRDVNAQIPCFQPGSLPAAYLTPALKDKLHLCQLSAAPGKE